MRRLGVILAAMLSLFLSACMTTQALKLRAQPPATVELSDVPYYAQRDFQCGPATLAMVMTYLGQPVTPDALAPELYLPGRQGTLTDELVAQARLRGFIPEKLPQTLRALADSLAEGAPVIVLQNNGLSWYPIWHYAVLIGSDAGRGEVVLRSGDQKRLVMSWSVLDRTWARGDYWAIRLLPVAGPWPASASEAEVTRQLLAMVRPAPSSAQTGLRQAVQRWPQGLALWLALADVSERLDGLPAGEKVLREALTAQPDQPWLLNNLADLLRRAGRAGEALPLAQRALAQSDRAEIRDTLQAINLALATPVSALPVKTTPVKATPRPKP